ncbi:hypothetical protein RHO13_02205 [Orbus wheelerorum]|uniref:hypothetical protein n=1 Tax=Orbus wheelerorum TaxID=3074111 RepID=UPI00370DDE15
MAQEFNGEVNDGQFAARDIVNNINHNIEQVDGRLLVPAQRKELNSLISDIETFGEYSSRDVWRKVHALLGVSSINGILLCQYEKAETFLRQELNKTTEKDNCKRLIHYILKETTNKNELKNKMNRYCQEQFGTSDLKAINKEQLQKALSYVRSENEQQSMQQKDFISQIILLIKNQPKPILAIFIVGFILGIIVF